MNKNGQKKSANSGSQNPNVKTVAGIKQRYTQAEKRAYQQGKASKINDTPSKSRSISYNTTMPMYKDVKHKPTNARMQDQTWYKMQKQNLLSPCARLWAKALVNPFGNFEMMPCIPDLISTPSFKFAARAQGIFKVGTNGTGFICVNPFSMVSSAKQKVPPLDATPENLYAPSCVGTSATYPYLGVQIPQMNNDSDPTSWISAGSDSPIEDFDLKYKARLVGAGVKVAYVGKMLDRAGRVILYAEPSSYCIGSGQKDAAGIVSPRGAWQNYTTTNQIPVETLLKNKAATATFLTDRAHFVGWTPMENDDLSYKAYAGTTETVPLFKDTFASAGGNWVNSADPSYVTATPRYCLMFLVDGATAGSAFEYEAISFFEVVGTSLPSITRSHSDPVGMAAVKQALPIKAPTGAPATVEKEVATEAKGFVEESSGLANLAGLAAKVAGAVL